MDHDSLATAIPEVLARYGLEFVASPQPVPGGTLNWNFRIESNRGRWFLRRYRDNLETERIVGEHALVEWVAARGIPAPVPVRAEGGWSILEFGVSRWALFPWAAGIPVERGTLSSKQVRALGELHGALQAALAEHPESQGAQMVRTWDKVESVRLLARILERAAEVRAEEWMLSALQRQLAMLEAFDVQPPEFYSSLPGQMLHGDFHDQQVLWDGNRIAALTDWEIWHTDPRVWELIRSLAFSLLLGSPLLEDYLAGFREHVQLGEDECSLGLRLWWQSRVVGLWAWAAYFLQGNKRVADFLPAMADELDRVGDAAWRERLEARFIRAACG